MPIRHSQITNASRSIEALRQLLDAPTTQPAAPAKRAITLADLLDLLLTTLLMPPMCPQRKERCRWSKHRRSIDHDQRFPMIYMTEEARFGFAVLALLAVIGLIGIAIQ